jgi:hypothetical protein
MKVMVLVKESNDSDADVCHAKETELAKFNDELTKAGVFQAIERLHPSSTGKRVTFSGPSRTMIDGPFAETKEIIAGFWLWKVNSMQEAVEWLKRAPFDGGTEVEIRPVIEPEDFSREKR